MSDYIQDGRPDDPDEKPRKPFNIEPEPQATYDAWWQEELWKRAQMARRLKVQRHLMQAYFDQFTGEE